MTETRTAHRNYGAGALHRRSHGLIEGVNVGVLALGDHRGGAVLPGHEAVVDHRLTLQIRVDSRRKQLLERAADVTLANRQLLYSFRH